MAGLVYDAGALIAAERGDPRLLAIHRRFGQMKERPVVPVVVLAQVWRGRPAPLLSKVLKNCEIVPDDEIIGKVAGVACAASGTTDVADAIVVVTAIARQAAIVTSDPRDLQRIAEAMATKIPLIALS